MRIRYFLVLVYLIIFPVFTQANDPEFLEKLDLTPAEKKWLEKSYTIKVHPDTWPPFNFWDDRKNKNRGIGPDYLAWIQKRTGLKFEFIATQMSLDLLLQKLSKKDIDFSPSLQYQPEREQYLIYTEPYYKSKFGFFVLNKDGLMSHNKRGFRISCEKSSTTHNFIAQNYPTAEIIECPSEKDGLLLLSQGKVDAHAGCIDVCDYLIAGSGNFSEIQQWKELPIEHQQIYMAVRKDWPQLASVINKSLQLMPLAEKNAIIRKYEKEIFLKRNQTFIVFAGFFVFIILIGLFIALISLYKRSRKVAYLNKLAMNRAEESANFKSVFLANMSHEIRSPMNAILGLTSLLKSEGLDSGTKDTYLTYIDRSGQQLLSLINDILDISKLEAGKISIELESFYLKSILDEIFLTYRSLAENKGLEFGIDENAENKDLIIRSDRAKVIQVLTNLISNAIKYTESGEVKYGYYLPDHHTVTFYVKDTGAGIPDNMKHLIFDRFKRLDQTRDVRGTGLGLSISKGLVELLGGTIWVEPNQNRAGSVFKFSLPFQESEKQTENILSKEISKESLQFTNQTILVAEDHEFSFVFLNQVLKNAGLKVVRAHDGKEVLRIVQKQKVDLVLMDIKMPVMSGYEATREIKKIAPEIPVIIQSAYVLPEEKEKAFQYGCDDYIIKPIDSRELFSKIHQHLQQMSFQ